MVDQNTPRPNQLSRLYLTAYNVIFSIEMAKETHTSLQSSNYLNYQAKIQKHQEMNPTLKDKHRRKNHSQRPKSNATNVQTIIKAHTNSQTELQNHKTSPPSPCPSHHKRPRYYESCYPRSNPLHLHFSRNFSTLQQKQFNSLCQQSLQSHS